MAVDIQQRAAYLVSKTGGVRAAAREAKMPYSTFRRIFTGEVKTTKTNRAKLNRTYRAKAPVAVKEREKRGLGSFELVDEKTARKLEASYKKQGKEVVVVAHSTYGEGILGVFSDKKEYGKGNSVDSALLALEVNYDRLILAYTEIDVDRKETLFRVYPKGIGMRGVIV
jgi:hypothetical protein